MLFRSTACIIAALADRAGWHRGALGGAAAYLIWLNLLEGQGGQSPVFYNVLTVGAAWLAMPRRDDAAAGMRRGLAAMALIALAMEIKTSVLLEGVALGLWLLARARATGRPIGQVAAYAAALVAVALLPTLAAWGWFAAHGHGGEWVYANITSILQRQSDPAAERYSNLAKLILITSPLLAMAALAWRVRARDGEGAAAQRFLFGWAAVACGSVLAFGTWFDHYALPMLVPLAACAAGFLGEHRRGPRWALPILAFVAIGGHVLLVTKVIRRVNAAEFAALVAAVERAPAGCLFVYSGPPMLYRASGRCVTTRYVFPSHLPRTREQGAIGVDSRAELDRILATGPAVVVMQQVYSGEERPIRRHFIAALRAAGYRLHARTKLGNQPAFVLVRGSH